MKETTVITEIENKKTIMYNNMDVLLAIDSTG